MALSSNFGLSFKYDVAINNYLSSFGKQKLLKSCETGTFENRE
jgi:hypothetical protein